MPYLVAKADKYDGFSGNPMHTWNTTVTAAAIQRAWPSLGTLKRVVVTQRDGHGDWYGRVERMTLDGSKNNVDVYRRHLPLEVRTPLELVQVRLERPAGKADQPVEHPLAAAADPVVQELVGEPRAHAGQQGGGLQ